MPELPEVETIRQDLRAEILGQKISCVKINASGSVRGQASSFVKLLEGNFFSDIQRIGKLLIFELGDGKHLLLVHLKMTGQLILISGKKLIAGGHGETDFSLNNLPNSHTRVQLTFKNKAQLFFNDLRRFGYWQIIKHEDLSPITGKFGIEPLTKNFTFANFTLALKNKKKSKIKAVLLDQQKIAGIGNIYADEILFASGVKPARLVGSLKPEELKKIFQTTEVIIKKAIKHRGTTFNNYVDASGRKGNFTKQLKVYGRKGKTCVQCGGLVKKIKLAGRGTHYCEKCQA